MKWLIAYGIVQFVVPACAGVIGEIRRIKREGVST